MTTVNEPLHKEQLSVVQMGTAMLLTRGHSFVEKDAMEHPRRQRDKNAAGRLWTEGSIACYSAGDSHWLPGKWNLQVSETWLLHPKFTETFLMWFTVSNCRWCHPFQCCYPVLNGRPQAASRHLRFLMQHVFKSLIRSLDPGMRFDDDRLVHGHLLYLATRCAMQALFNFYFKVMRRYLSM